MMQKSGDSPATVVAIGDVHGCADLLEQTLAPHLGSGAELIFLGDLIDRSPDRDGDRRVVERVRQLQEQPDAYGLAGVTVLRGNHEQMLLDALHEPDPGDATELWAWNGGDPALAARHNCETRCNRTGLMAWGGQGAMRGWGHHTKPIARGFPRPAPL
jgi:hypothetical protein